MSTRPRPLAPASDKHDALAVWHFIVPTPRPYLFSLPLPSQLSYFCLLQRLFCLICKLFPLPGPAGSESHLNCALSFILLLLLLLLLLPLFPSRGKERLFCVKIIAKPFATPPGSVHVLVTHSAGGRKKHALLLLFGDSRPPGARPVRRLPLPSMRPFGCSAMPSLGPIRAKP